MAIGIRKPVSGRLCRFSVPCYSIPLELAEAYTARGGHALVLEGRDSDGAIFSSGGGDGCYRTYALLSDVGKPVAFVTDFYDALPPP